jgi:hypothetical protein
VYSSAAKSAAEIPRMKFRFPSIFEHFEAVSSLLLANSLRPLRHLYSLSKSAFRDLQFEVKGIIVRRNIDKYDISCCGQQMSHSFVKQTPS